MRNDNYPSASEMVRNLADIKVRHEVLAKEGKFRIVKFDHPFFQGSEIWVVNERGFMWEPADSLEEAQEYIKSPEAVEYGKDRPEPTV